MIIYVGVPFMLDIVRRRPSRYWIWLLAGLAVFRLAVIAQHRKPFTERIEWLSSHLQEWRSETGAHNFYLPLSQAPTDTLLMTWGIPYETLLLSSLESPDHTATLVVLPEPGAHAEALQNGGFLVTEFGDWGVESLRVDYFKVDTRPYIYIEK
ncbi:MAG: hypothetical protein IPN33_04400 [Saprospiraceae bacterium]|nr:hypothetical protein [Saprospiraceae bacterium]